ncbi:zinc finger protein STAMENLESS 1-like [Aristolochia californica]|uniref:zinc finger protein STAMENLESS 1-like n=1 Tax=Aristolochia californica TaxID=171875 RepID=UPI0035DAC16B
MTLGLSGREEGSPLDLNNLPEEYGERYREGKQVLEESSTASAEASDSNRHRKKKSGGKEGKDECEKVYECRFCSLKFCKSQALGGHMNRHRQERETETLNRARQLVFSNESLAAQGPLSHLGCSAQTIPSGNFHQRGVMGDPSLPLRTVYTRLPSPSSPSILPPPQPYMYPSSSRLLSYPSSYPAPVTDYFIGHVVPNSSHHHQHQSYGAEPNYTCMGAPIAHGFSTTDGMRGTASSATRGGGPHGRFSGGSLNCSYPEEQGLEPPSIHRFRDDF